MSVWAQADTTYKSRLSDTLKLGEVTISIKSAVSIKGDTVSYRADSFYKDPLSSTEDVLKKIPGVEVDEDGKILVNGKQVKYILINGKEFEVEDITTITQNLPANVIEKIQLADYHSKEEIFTGLKKNSEEKVVNLKLKKEYSSGVVGRVAAGYGTKDRYQTGVFANYMGNNGSRTTVLGALSNTGVTRVSNTDDDNSAWRYPGIRTGQKGSVNFTLGGSEKWDVKGTYSYSGGGTFLQQNKARTTYLQNDSLLLQDENQEKNTDNNRHYLKIRSEANLNEKTRLDSRFQLSYNANNSIDETEDLTYSGSSEAIDFRRYSTNNNKSQNGRYVLVNNLMRRLGKSGRTVIFNSNLSYTNAATTATRTNDNTYYDPYSVSSVTNKSDNNNDGYNSQLGIKYNEPIGERLTLSVDYSNVYDKSTADNRVAVLNVDLYEIDTNQTRIFVNTSIEHTGGLNLRYQHEKITSGLGITALAYDRKNKEQLKGDATQVQKGINYAPSAYLRFNLSKTRTIQLNYNGRVQTPHFRQLQPIPDYTDSLNIFIGNPGLKPQIRNNIRLRYSSNNTKGSNFWANLYVNWEGNKIVNKTELTNSKRVTTPVNANGNYSLSGSFSLTQPIVKNRFKIALSSYNTMENRVVILNSVFSNLKTYNFSPRVRLVFTTEKSIESNLSFSYNWNEVAAVGGGKNTLRKYNISHESFIKLPLNFRWSYNLRYTYNNGINSSFEQSFILFSTSLDKSFEKLRGLNFRFQIFDAFNDYPVVNRRIGDSYFEDVSVNRLGRYMMFSVIYKFTSFPAGDTK